MSDKRDRWRAYDEAVKNINDTFDEDITKLADDPAKANKFQRDTNQRLRDLKVIYIGPDEEEEYKSFKETGEINDEPVDQQYDFWQSFYQRTPGVSFKKTKVGPYKQEVVPPQRNAAIKAMVKRRVK